MASATLNILMIEDTEADFLLVERFLKKQLPPFRSRRVTSNPVQRARDILGRIGDRFGLIQSIIVRGKIAINRGEYRPSRNRTSSKRTVWSGS